MKQLEELQNAISEINLSSSPIDEIRVKADALNRPRKERAETERDAAQEGWRTIESAPKDGKVFLAFSPSAGHRLIRWATGVEKYIGIPSGVALVTATHWRPLPAPPRADGE
jgi:hypothetical protein